MRPLDRPTLPAQLLQVPAARLLVSAFGNFCAFCERPLLDNLWVWNARTGHSLEGDSCGAEDWEHLYLLDHNCHAAQQHADPADLPLLLLPTDPEARYRAGETPALQYSLKKLQQVLIDEHQHIIRNDQVHCVVVGATHPRAQATIRYFALNTTYLDEDRLVIPWEDHQSLLDRRMHQRTDAWHKATKVADLLREHITPGVADAMSEQLRQIIGSTGFWASCWASVAQVIWDQQRLQQIFAANQPATPPPIACLPAKHAVHFLGNGPHQPFPGTAPF
ncbi:hypothetical protein ABE525_07850 [Pseudomonas wadenswilerensis]|jgi:hypothetical protein|uniref:Putative transmembrane protein n=1 Tax=Pseudomonas wadenswilerensis TaxID=1785161 RepID=A0A380SYX4_9PSED|nr:hypothetical protein [Pseudomonas wadenswilerensis]SUQ62943.1 putative transmembrane protein [Pseudomonas wadenswilerensis]